jgi:hypothetical protein
MTTKNDASADEPQGRQARSLTLALAMVCAFASPGRGFAQNTPYQASQRQDFGSALGQNDLPKGGRFEPRIEAAAQYANNINLAEEGEDQVDTFGIEASPGFYASYSTDAVLAAIDYSLIARAWEDSDYNDVSHQLSANGEWVAVPEWFSLSGQASYGDTILDPRNGLNYGGIGVFGGGNLAEVATASVMPRVSHRFNDLQFVADYMYGRTWYLDEGKGLPVVGIVSGGQDSEDQTAGVSFGTAPNAGSKLTGSLFYDWQKSEYDLSLPYEFERAGVDLGLQVSRTLTLVGDVGKESALDEDSTSGGLDSDFWSAGLRWDPNERTSAEGRYGERFFGDSWSLEVTHSARLLEFTAAYSEEPTVETRQLSLGTFDPGTLPPGFPPIDFGILTSVPYVARNASAGVTAEGSRTTLTLQAFQFERDYVRLGPRDETTLGAFFGVTRQLASNMSADFNVTYNDYERSTFDLDPSLETTTRDKDTTVLVRLSRDSGPRLTLSGETGYLTRSGDSDYDGWWVALRARWTP